MRTKIKRLVLTLGAFLVCQTASLFAQYYYYPPGTVPVPYPPPVVVVPQPPPPPVVVVPEPPPPPQMVPVTICAIMNYDSNVFINGDYIGTASAGFRRDAPVIVKLPVGARVRISVRPAITSLFRAWEQDILVHGAMTIRPTLEF